MIQQTDFFSLVDQGPKIMVTVYKIADHVFQATIAGGWWVAFGDTQNDAVKQVVERYSNEQTYFS